MSDEVCMITGGGSGMGAAAAREMHVRGYKLALMTPSESCERLASELGGVAHRGVAESADDLQALFDHADLRSHRRRPDPRRRAAEGRSSRDRRGGLGPGPRHGAEAGHPHGKVRDPRDARGRAPPSTCIARARSAAW